MKDVATKLNGQENNVEVCPGVRAPELEGALMTRGGGLLVDALPARVVRENDGTLRVRFSPGWVRFQRRP